MLQPVWCDAAIAAATLALASALVGFRRRIRALRIACCLVVGAALVAVTGGLVFTLQSRATLERLEIARTVDVLRTATRIAAIVARAESGQRGYLLTQDPKYLAAFTIASGQIGPETIAFRRLVANDAAVVAPGGTLLEKIGAKFDEIRSTLRALDRQSRQESLAIIKTDRGLELTAAIEGLIDRIKHTEQAHLDELTVWDRETDTRAGYATAGCLLVAMLAILAAAVFAYRDHRAQFAAKAAIADRNAMLALAGKIANIGHWRLAIDEMRVTWSDEVFRIHGLDPADGVPPIDHAIEAYAPKDRERVAKIVETSIRTAEGFEFEATLVRPDGTEADVISRAVCACDEGGRVTSLFGVFMNVTDIRKSQRSLARSERLYRLLAENVTDVLVRVDGDLRLTFVSPSSVGLLGRAPDEMVGASLPDLVHPDDRDALLRALAQRVAGIDEAHAGAV